MPRRGERKYTTMMLYPAMNTLTKNVPNRYLLQKKSYSRLVRKKTFGWKRRKPKNIKIVS